MALDVDAVDATGEWLRHIPHSADPRSRSLPAGDNRWQRGAVVDALYLAGHEETLWAEWYRYLAERGLPPMRQVPRDLWRFRVRTLEVADVGREDRLARVGLPLPTPGRKTWPSYQQIGETLWRDGWSGLLAPSATHEPRPLPLHRRPATPPCRAAAATDSHRRAACTANWNANLSLEAEDWTRLQDLLQSTQRAATPALHIVDAETGRLAVAAANGARFDRRAGLRHYVAGLW